MGGAARTEALVGPAPGVVVVLVLATCGAVAGGLLLAARLGAARERRSRSGGSRTGDDEVAGERGLVALELHDILSHAVSVMVLQAAGARRVVEQDPERAAQALAQIERLGRDTMGELRRLLALLREAELVPDDAVRLVPPRGLGDVPGLADRMRDRGLPVRLERQGRPRRLDASVDLAAYRIVAHALERIAGRGGAGVSAVVREVWTAEVLIVEITGERMAPVTAAAVRPAWAGPRERVHLAGGRLEAACLPDGGGRLVVTLPVASSAPRSRPTRAAGPP